MNSLYRSVGARYGRLRTFLDGYLDRAMAPDARWSTLAEAACAVLIALGVFWRFVDLAYPPHFTFDEHHFVENARNYIKGLADWNDHPPLGKLLIVPGILLLGDNGLGWRIHEAVLGALHIYVVYRLARALFGDRRTGLITAAFVAVDGMFVAYSRTALLDIPMNFFMMGSLLLMAEARSLKWFAAAAVSLALAVSVKWIAVLVVLVTPFFLLRKGRSVLHVLWMGPLIVAIYTFIWWLHLVMTHEVATLAEVVRRNGELLKGHASATDWQNAADSRWYTWPLLWKPIMLHRAELPDRYFRVMTTLGNPVVWYFTTATWVLALVEVGRALWARVRGGAPSRPATGEAADATAAAPPPMTISSTVRTQALLLATAVALILQWLLTNRESYLWHYMGSYTLGIMLASERVTRLWRSDALKVVLLLVAVGAVSVYYAPVWTNGLMSKYWMYQRLLMPRWR